MKRRDFITLLGGAAAAWPLAARAAAAFDRVLGVGSKTASARYHSGFPQGLRELGYVEGRDSKKCECVKSHTSMSNISMPSGCRIICAWTTNRQ
jgi:hypothetical protein